MNRLTDRHSDTPAWTLPNDSLMAINLHHHAHQGRFGAGEVAHFEDAAPVLHAAVARHIELRTNRMNGRSPLRQRCPGLTERELDALERLLLGMTYDGIAADMGLAIGAVKTYRVRAFGRLGIHFKSQLFACVQRSR